MQTEEEKKHEQERLEERRRQLNDIHIFASIFERRIMELPLNRALKDGIESISPSIQKHSVMILLNSKTVIQVQKIIVRLNNMNAIREIFLGHLFFLSLAISFLGRFRNRSLL
ncbi:unnamed protein product [Onchocerca flexuosa]|uniref:Uncharacterized protein n=1 Tax=Onchocerca flexuosa TaxID=387005 RepID=A0A3P7XS79_9BILA|nr:unnamed protein product [Onchocerca flexuosa]